MLNSYKVLFIPYVDLLLKEADVLSSKKQLEMNRTEVILTYNTYNVVIRNSNNNLKLLLNP